MSGEEEFARRRPMLIEYTLQNERKRLAGKGMTDEERAWRAQWVKDQILKPDEPTRSVRPYDIVDAKVERWHALFRNPIRRVYRAPWDGIRALLTPIVGEGWARTIRYFGPKYLMFVGSIFAVHYYFKYHQNDWTREGGWRVYTVKPRSWPGDPDFPRPEVRTEPADYADRGFKARKVFLD